MDVGGHLRNAHGAILGHKVNIGQGHRRVEPAFHLHLNGIGQILTETVDLVVAAHFDDFLRHRLVVVDYPVVKASVEQGHVVREQLEATADVEINAHVDVAADVARFRRNAD